jgi:putative transposase
VLFYRAVDKLGNTVDFLLTRKRRRMNAQSFLIKAMYNCRARVINIDKSGSNTAAIKVYNRRSFSKIKIRQCKYLNNIVEQDHRFIKWRIQNALGFKSFESAKRTNEHFIFLINIFTKFSKNYNRHYFFNEKNLIL